MFSQLTKKLFRQLLQKISTHMTYGWEEQNSPELYCLCGNHANGRAKIREENTVFFVDKASINSASCTLTLSTIKKIAAPIMFPGRTFMEKKP